MKQAKTIDVNRIKEILLQADDIALQEALEFIHPVDILTVLHEFPEEVEKLLDRLDNETIAELIDFEEDEDKIDILNHFSDLRQRGILNEMSSDEITGLVSNLDEKEKKDVLDKMSQEDRAEVTELLSYKKDSAGAMMATEFISIRENKTILKTLEYLHSVVHEAEMAYYLYVIDKPGHLKGVVSLRDIVASNFDTCIHDITNTNVTYVHVDDDQEEVARVFAKYDYLMLPVVDDDDVIRGVITIDDVIDIIHEETTEDIHRLAGLDEEEKVDGNLLASIKSRLPWLTVNVFTASLTGTVVSYFSATLDQIIILAAITPIIAGLGGNAGTQALTLTVRGIALGELTLKNAKPIFFKELGVGMTCGVCIGTLVAIGCQIIYGNPVLGLVVGIAMMCNLIIATLLGYCVPFILKQVNIDPALASSIFVTAATDILGYSIFLSLATISLPYLV